MTVQSTASQQTYLGNGTSTIFPIPFKYESTTHIFARYVYPTIPVTYTPLNQGVDFTVTVAGVSGTLTTSVPVPAGTTMQIYRVVPLTQLLNLVANNQFPAAAMMQELDLIVEGMQSLQDQITGTAAGIAGGLTSIVNEGLSGTGVFDHISGTTAFFRNLIAGAGIGFSIGTDGSITINNTTSAGALLAANNLSDVASRQTALNTLAAASTTSTNEYVLTKDTATGNIMLKVVPTGGAGEANTLSTRGGTYSLAGTKVGVDLGVKGLNAGANVTIVDNGTSLTVSAAAAAGATSVALKSGAVGQLLATDITASVLHDKGLNAGLGLTLASSGTDLTYAVDQAAALTWTGKQKFLGDLGAAELFPQAFWQLPGMTNYAIKASRTTPTSATGTGTNEGNIQSYVKVRSDYRSNEYAFYGVLDDYSTTSANVVNNNGAMYLKAYKHGASAIWGAIFEVEDVGDGPGHVLANMYGIEISLAVTSTDTTSNRVLAGMYYGPVSGQPITTLTKQTGGIQLRPVLTFGAGDPNAFYAGLIFGMNVDGGNVDYSYITGARGINAFTAIGRYSGAAIDVSASTQTNIALAMGGGSALAFNAGTGSGTTATILTGVQAGATAGVIRVLVGGANAYINYSSSHT